MCGSGLISIIIPVFNVRPYLEKALESVIRQTYSHLEIIVIDDGSTDGSGVICDEFAKRDERIKVVHQQNRGLSSARNAGLDIMNGKAVAFLDPDDSYHPDYIKVMAEAMEREKADIVVCRYIVHYANKKSGRTGKEKARPRIKAGTYTRIEVLQALIDKTVNVGVWNKLYRSRLWDTIRFPDGHNYEDNDTTFKVLDLCSSVFVLDQTLYYHLKRPGSITTTVSEANINDINLAKSHFEEFVSANTPAVFTFGQLSKVRQATLYVMIKKYIRYRSSICSPNDRFIEKMRTQIAEKGEELGVRSMAFHGKAAYLMLLKCPKLLKAAYPAYRLIRKLIYEIKSK